MKKLLGCVVALVAALSAAGPVEAQGNEAKASLYTRIEGERATAALVLRVTPGWYIYHTDLGHPDAIGTPLALDLQAEGVEWGEMVFQEPHIKAVDDPVLGQYTYNYHVGKVFAYAVGSVAAGTNPGEVSLSLSGQTCTDLTGVCVSYDESVTSKGEGRESDWKAWPASLVTPPAPSNSEPNTAPNEAAQPGVPALALGPPTAVFPAEKVSGKLWVRRGDGDQAGTARAVIELNVREGFHIYHGPTHRDLGHPEAIGTPTTFVLDGGGCDWGMPTFPPPHPEDQGIAASDGEGNIWINSHHGVIRIQFTGSLWGEYDPDDLFAEVEGQVCDDMGCQPWALELESEGGGPDDAFEWEVADPAPPETGHNDGPSHEDEPSLLKFLLAAVGWGIFTLLMPCTYPMIPITISFFTKQADARDGNVLPLSLTYGVGIVSVFILIGLLFAPVIIPFATHPITNLVIGVLFLFFSLVLFGFVELQPPQSMMAAAGKASAKGGYVGVFLMGATLVITSFTCTAPFVGTLLGSAATGEGVGQDALRIVLGMGVFGLTMATPFVLLSLLPGKVQQMPQAGEWMNTLKVFLGFVEVAASLKFLSNADIVWEWGILGRDVFLAAWCVIFVAAGIYLIKQARFAGRQAVLGAITVVMGGYFGYGVPGNGLDEVITTPLLPPYVVFESNSPSKANHTIIKDDWDGALALAREEGKLVLVNFTGFT